MDEQSLVIDVDGQAGRESLAALEAQYAPLPVTLTSITGRADGGEHRFFHYPIGRSIGSNAGVLGKGLDTRATGGYVVAPPSLHRSGQTYRWKHLEQPVVEAPVWILELLGGQRRKESNTSGLLAKILAEGERNDGLFRFGCALRRKGRTIAEIQQELLRYNARNCDPPLDVIEVQKIAESAGRYAVGGPDPLEIAWQATKREAFSNRKSHFFGLCRHLQDQRPNKTIALPIKRIAKYFGVHWTTISNYRKDGVKSGVLIHAERYVAGRLAARYRMVNIGDLANPEILTRPPALTKSLISDLVRTNHVESFPSENIAPAEIQPNEPKPIHASVATLQPTFLPDHRAATNLTSAAQQSRGPLPVSFMGKPGCPHGFQTPILCMQCRAAGQKFI